MANLSITLKCNRSCAYCFAQGLAGNGGDMSLSLYHELLDWLERSGRDQVRLLGGEPTLHPKFPRMVEDALQRNFKVLVFSNGIMSGEALDALTSVDGERMLVLVNLNQPGGELGEHGDRQRKALARLGERAMVGCNIHQPNPSLAFLLDAVKSLGLKNRVRLGLAHPVWGGENRSLSPKHYAAAGLAIARFAQDASEKGIGLEFDCGFVPCMFPQWFWDLPLLEAGSIGPRCGPVPDVLPGGRAVPCYPLAGLCETTLARQEDAGDVVERLGQSMEHLRPLGIHAHCGTCHWRESGRCLGGCLSAALGRLRGNNQTLSETMA